MSVQWNRDTKTLSLPDGITSYVATDAEQASINDAKEIMRLSLLDLGVSTKNFAVTQQAILLSSMKEILGIQDLQVAFDAAHPEWNDGVMYAKAQADSQTTNFSFDQIYTSLVHQKSDTLGILRQDYGAYEWMLGDFMKQAMTVLAKMRAGMSQREAITPLEDAMYRQSYSLPMYRLASIGIHFPSTDALLRATAAVSDAVMHDMLRIQEDERQAILRDQAASNNPDYAGTGISEELLAQYAAEEKAAHLHNLVVISQSEGDGDPLARAWAYGTNNGLTEVEMREALGLTQEQVDLILGKITDLTDDGSDKIVTPEGDILTRMSRDSLTRIRDNATRALASAIARDDAENTAFFTLQLEAADGLLALIPTGENTPVIGENATALGWKELIERTTSDPTGEGSKLFIGGLQLDLKTLQHMEIDHDTDLGRFAGAKLIDFPTHMSAGVSKTYTFQLTETAMVNLWTRGAGLHDLNLRISGGGIGFGYPSQKSGMNGGESISLKLTPGTYTFTIEDKTQYGSLYMGSYVGTADYKVTTGIDITPFNSANIEGKISIDGSPKVMPVSMRVAEFDTSGQRKTNYDITEGNDAITRLNPSLPVWVVIHGRKDSERGNSINELTQRLVESSNGRYQVVTVNWEDAAKDIAMPFGIDIGDLEDAKWTPAVGKWIGQQLLAAGFKAADIRFAAHSHGTFGAYFAAEWIKEKTGGQLVGTIIAMDSAKNPVFFGAGIPEERIQFKNVSQNSIGIHSSFLGSANRAFGAHRSIGVSSPDTISPLTEHGYAVTLFSDALDDINHGINMNIATIFALNDRGNIPVGFIPDKEGYDAWISVRSSKKVTETGDWWRAQASALWYKKPDGTWENPLFDPEIINSSDSLPEFPSSGEGTLIN